MGFAVTALAIVLLAAQAVLVLLVPRLFAGHEAEVQERRRGGVG